MYTYGFRTFFFNHLLSFLVLKLLWHFHLPENMLMCTSVMKRKKEMSFAFDWWWWDVWLLWGSALKSESSFGGNPAAQIYKPPLLAGSFVSAGEWMSWRERDHISSAMLGSLWGWWEPAVQSLSCMLPLQRGGLERVVMVWYVHSNLGC